MKTFSAQPGPSALLEYCKIRPGFEASFTIKPGLYSYLQCVWRLALTERKTERELARARISVVSSQQHGKQQQVCEERTCLVHVQVWASGPLRSLHGHGAWRLFFLEFSRWGFMYIFSRLPRRFSENLRWPSRDEMAGCLHGKLYAFSSRPGQVSTRSFGPS